jgi:poly-gamma-glutamate synthesis protein (capsule biosynthesis protein)
MNHLTFLGDVWLPRAFKSAVQFDGDFIFNLESPITRCDQPAHAKICLQAPENYIEATFGKKPLAVSLANNHIMDFGHEGYEDTLKALESSRIRFFGAGTLEQNCNNPLIVPVGQSLVGLLGYVCPSTCPVLAQRNTPGVMPIELARIQADILQARHGGAKFVILNLHWGEEDVGTPKPQDVAFARQLLEIGADLIIGHHSHCIQSHETRGTKSIFYGLGNCIFPDEWALRPSEAGEGFVRTHLCFPRKSKHSLMVRVELASGVTTVSALRFTGIELRRENLCPDKFELPRMDSEQYSSYYDRRYHRDIWFARLGRLLVRPRFPKPSSFRYGLRGLLRSFRAG